MVSCAPAQPVRSTSRFVLESKPRQYHEHSTSSIETIGGNGYAGQRGGCPRFHQGLAPDTIDQGAERSCIFTIDNSANLIEASTPVFSSVSAGVVVADTPNVNNTCGGTFTATAGNATVDLRPDGVGATCTIDVTVRADVAGSLDNTTSADLFHRNGDGRHRSLTVNAALPPVFTKVFAPDTIDQPRQS